MSGPVILPGTRHRCALPDPDPLPDGALAQCPLCHRWSFKWTDYSVWVAHRWAFVRWFMWRLRRRIRIDQDDT